MARQYLWLLILVLFGCLFGVLHAGGGETDPLYRSCVEMCESSGSCQPPISSDVPKIVQKWRLWGCRSDCRHTCVRKREMERRELGLEPVKYHGKWANTQSGYLQNVISALLPVFNLLAHLYGWLSFLHLHLKSPPAPISGTSFLEYAGMWHIQGLLATIAWFWSSICQAWEFDTTERLAYSAAVVLISYSLVLSTVCTFNLRREESKVITAAPILGFAMTHICYINYVSLAYGFNKTICCSMCMAQILLWFMWAVKRHNPSMYKVWLVCVGGSISFLLELVDSRSLWHAIAIPLTWAWWSFIGDDARLVLESQPAKKKA